MVHEVKTLTKISKKNQNHGSEPLSSPAPVGQSAGNLESCGGKNVRARLYPFHLNWPQPVLSGQTKGKRGVYWTMGQV